MVVLDPPHSSSIALIAASLAVFVVLIVTNRTKSNSRGLPYPPGPRAHAIIGNLRDFPTVQPWLTYTRWQKEYGELLLL